MRRLQAAAAARVESKGKSGIFHAARAGDLAAVSDHLLVDAACVHYRDELPPPAPPHLLLFLSLSHRVNSTPLHVACDNRHAAAAHMLLQYGADPDATEDI